MGMSRPRIVPEVTLEKYLEGKEIVTYGHLRIAFADIAFDPETAYRWLAKANWEPRYPRRRDVWQRKQTTIRPAIRRARLELSLTLTARGATPIVSSSGVG